MSLITPSRATLADALATVRLAPMAERRRQDMVSALNTIGRVLGRGLSEIQLDLRALNAGLKHVSPKAFGITTARWHNVRSLFRSALALNMPMLKGRNAEPMSKKWASLHGQITVRGDRIKLSRPLRWFTAHKIAPDAVTAEDLTRFHKCLSEEALLRNPEATWNDATLAWNRAAGRITGWPRLRISGQSRRKSYVLP